MVLGCEGSLDPAYPAERAFPENDGEVREGELTLGDEVRVVEVAVVDGTAVLEGDILLDPGIFRLRREEGGVSSSRHELATIPADRLWPGGVVPYVIDPGLPAPQRVHQAIAHWNQTTPIQLVPRTNEADFVRFIPGDGCASYVGRIGGEQEIWLHELCGLGTTIHEIGHAVGSFHEQSRTDRDQHVRILWENIESGMEYAFQRFVDQDQPGQDIGPYDLGSIMHYDSFAFSANGKPTIVRADGQTFQSNRQALSAGDIAGIHALYSQPVSCADVDRLAGPTRVHTAIEISKAFHGSAPAAVIVGAENRSAPDALSAGPLARRLGGPILLSTAASLPSETQAELDRLGASTVYVIGGTAAISETVVSQLRASGRQVVRIAGASRYDTAAQVAEQVGSPSGIAFVASGSDQNLADALAASGPAAQLGAPVLLVTRDSVPPATAAALSSLGIQQTIVLGGTAAVSDSVAAQLPGSTRIAGASRYHTAAALAEHAVTQLGLTSTEVFIARGDVMADALAAGAAGQITLLSSPTSLPEPAAQFLSARADRAMLLGGEAALNSSVHQRVCDVLGQE